MNRIILGFVALLALTAQALGAGTIPLSGTQQQDTLGNPLSGGLLYTFVSGTTTPQAAYQDQALSIPYPNPMVLDASGRVPFFYLADGNIKIRLSDANGVTQVAADGLLVIGPSSGGSGGGGVDATTVLATGDTKTRYGTGVLSGFVRMNGRTLGSATSGATERANSDAQALFEYLWTTDGNLTVSSGRGASGNADWLANKTIALPDMRGRVFAGMDDMGSSAAGILTVTYYGQFATTLGARGGLEYSQLGVANLASHTHTTSGGSASVSGTTSFEAGHNHPAGGLGLDVAVGGVASGLGIISGSGAVGVASGAAFSVYPIGAYGVIAAGPMSGNTGAGSIHQHTVSSSGSASINVDATGSAVPFPNMPPSMVMTFYIKL